MVMDMLAAPLEGNSEETLEPSVSAGTNCSTQIRVKGRNVSVRSAVINGRNVITSGTWLKTTVVHDEELVEGEIIPDPASFVLSVKSAGLKADILTFAEKLPNTTPKFTYHREWDNLAVIPISTYSAWFEKRIDAGARRAVRKAAKEGVIVREAEFDDAFVEGIVQINNETPIRQGKPFWHFQKSFEAVKEENSTYANRNIFLGAYWEGGLIGYIRMTSVDETARMIQVLTMMKHYDKRPANALIAKAVEICEERKFSYLVYCNYIYNDLENSLTEFKRRNGFEKVLLPRYYIPLNMKGRIALSLGLHRGIAERIPKPLLSQLLKIRRQWHSRAQKVQEGNV
jgi:hypothetical protein